MKKYFIDLGTGVGLGVVCFVLALWVTLTFWNDFVYFLLTLVILTVIAIYLFRSSQFFKKTRGEAETAKGTFISIIFCAGGAIVIYLAILSYMLTISRWFTFS